MYDTAIIAGTDDATRRLKEAERAELIGQYETFEGYEAALKTKIEEAYDEPYLENLKNEIFGFSHVTVADMLTHLQSQCLALTTREKTQKLKDVLRKWDADEDVNTFFTKLDKLADELKDEYGIDWPVDLKTNHAVEQMYDSNQFTQDNMMDWEDKPEADKTWVHCQNYFGKLWEKNQRYKPNDSPRSQGYESAANIREATDANTEKLATNLRQVASAACADKEHIQLMSNQHEDMLTIVKKQQAQIDKLLNQNEKLISALGKLEIAAAPRPRQDGPGRGRSTGRGRGAGRGRYSSTPPTAAAEEAAKRIEEATKEQAKPGAPAKTDSAWRPICGICGKTHQTHNCFELDRNAGNRPSGWTSIFEE